MSDPNYFERKPGEASTSKYVQANVPTASGGTTKKTSMDDTPDAKVVNQLKKATAISIEFQKMTVMGFTMLIPKIVKKEIAEAKPTGDKAQYGSIQVTETKGGHVFIIDNTPGNRRIITLHPSGTYTSMVDNGDATDKTAGNHFTIVQKDWNVAIFGDHIEVIQGDNRVNIKKNNVINVEGDESSNVDGNGSYKYGKDLSINVVGSFNVTADGDHNMAVGGKSTTVITGKCKIKSNLIDIDGGTSDLTGVVNQMCLCSFTGKPHADVSKNVKVTKG